MQPEKGLGLHLQYMLAVELVQTCPLLDVRAPIFAACFFSVVSLFCLPEYFDSALSARFHLVCLIFVRFFRPVLCCFFGAASKTWVGGGTATVIFITFLTFRLECFRGVAVFFVLFLLLYCITTFLYGIVSF